MPAIKRFGRSGRSAQDTMEACRRSLYSAAAAQALAKRIPGADPEASFLAALLMDVGVLAMGQVIGEKYCAVVRGAEHHSDLPRLETERFGFNHAVVGTLLTRQWKVPDNLAGAIQYHHDPVAAPVENGARDMAKLIRLAALCADVFIEHNPLWPISEAYRISAVDFSLSKGTLGEVLEELARETRRLGAAFEIRIDPSATFARAQEIAARQVQECIADMNDASVAAPLPMPPNVLNQRREQRQKRSGTVNMFACSGATVGREMKASLRDISPTGIGLTLGVPLAPGFQFVVALRRGGQRLTAIQYEVRHCRANDLEDQFAVGAELTRVLREADLMIDSSEDSPLHRIGRKLLGRRD